MGYTESRMRRSNCRSMLLNAIVAVMAFYIILNHTPLVRHDGRESSKFSVFRENEKYDLDPGVLDDVAPVVKKKKIVLPKVIKKEVKIVPRETIYKKPKYSEKEKDVWHVLKADDSNDNDYIYSAYLDNRTTIEQTCIRVIGIFDESENHHHCLLWYEGKDQPTVVAAQYIRAPHLQWDSDKIFEGSILSCGVQGIHYPRHVSVIINLESQPTNLIEIQIPSRREKQKAFGVCLTQVYTNMTLEFYKFIEWMEALKMFGVKEITMYNETLSSGMAFIIETYVNDGLLVLQPGSELSYQEEPDRRVMNGFPIVNDCIYRNMYRYKKTLIIDLDELIIPKTTVNYDDLFSEINSQVGTDHPYPVYFFKTAYFFKSLPAKREPIYSVTLRYAYRAPLHNTYMFGASIIHPETIIALLNPNRYVIAPRYLAPGWNVTVPSQIALNQRYEKCEFDDLNFQEEMCQKAIEVIHIEHSTESFRDGIDSAMTAVFFRHDMEDDIFYGVGRLEDITNITEEVTNNPEMTALLQQQVENGNSQIRSDLAQQFKRPASREM